MPRDVATWWNSTFDLLNFAIDYQTAIEEMTAKCEHNLRVFELSVEEWKIASDLQEVLQVSTLGILLH
jgi:hypothetical protein